MRTGDWVYSMRVEHGLRRKNALVGWSTRGRCYSDDRSGGWCKMQSAEWCGVVLCCVFPSSNCWRQLVFVLAFAFNLLMQSENRLVWPQVRCAD